MLEDDFHRFQVDLTHGDGLVRTVEGRSIRTPWSTCHLAAANLAAFEGLPLTPEATPPREGPYNAHCTHLYDLARFAIAQGRRGGSRQYDIALPDDDGADRLATIDRDGEPLFIWTMRGREIVAPPAFAGHALRGRPVWAPGAIPDDDALEGALMLRRVLLTFRGRGGDFPDNTMASDVPHMAGACFAYLPGIAEQGRRTLDERDYTARPDALLGATT